MHSYRDTRGYNPVDSTRIRPPSPSHPPSVPLSYLHMPQHQLPPPPTGLTHVSNPVSQESVTMRATNMPSTQGYGAISQSVAQHPARDGVSLDAGQTKKKRGRKPGSYKTEVSRQRALQAARRVLESAGMLGAGNPPAGPSTDADVDPAQKRKGRGRPRGSFKSEESRRRAVAAAVRTLQAAGVPAGGDDVSPQSEDSDV